MMPPYMSVKVTVCQQVAILTSVPSVTLGLDIIQV